jgi:hypothetical protein
LLPDEGFLAGFASAAGFTSLDLVSIGFESVDFDSLVGVLSLSFLESPPLGAALRCAFLP